MSIMTELTPVIRVVCIWNIHTAPLTFSPSKVSTELAATEKVPAVEQYTPAIRMRPLVSVGARTVQLATEASLYAYLKSAAHAIAGAVLIYVEPWLRV